MNNEWKQIYNAIIDSCLTLLQEVDNIQGKQTGKTINDLERKKLEKLYRNIRAKINNDKFECSSLRSTCKSKIKTSLGM